LAAKGAPQGDNENREQSFLEEEFAGALGGFYNGFDKGDAQLPFLEFEDAVDGAASGSGNRVFEESGVVTGFEDDAGGTFHGLSGEECGDIPRQTDLYPSFSERFQDDIDKSGAAGGKTGDRVHVFLVDDNGAANGTEHGFGNFEMVIGSMGTPADAGHAAADYGTGVGHGADDWNLRADPLLDIGGGNGGGNGNDESVFPQAGLDFFQDIADNLWLYGEQDNVSTFDSLAIIGGTSDTEFDSDGGGLFLMADSGGDALGGEKALFEISAEEDAAEFAGAKNGKMLV